MNGSIIEKFTAERSLLYIAIAAILIVAGIVFYLFVVYSKESIQVLTPNGAEEWEIGQTYEITWKAKGVDKVGIALFKGSEPKWIVENISAGLGRYEWKIYPGQEYGPGFWIVVLEYPWREGNQIDYSDGPFAITFPETASCDYLSVDQEWLYLPNDLPNLRRVFITQENYTGNLDGLEGANEICQTEADTQGFGGVWHAFLGGDSDEDMAVERLKRTYNGTDGIFIAAEPSATIIRGATCHRLLAKDFEEFLTRLSGSVIINEEKLEQGFLRDIENLWLGRIDEESKKNCTGIASALSDYYKSLSEKYSFTITCQNWTQEDKYVGGYPVPSGEPKPSFPSCYTLSGQYTDAVALGALASGIAGKDKDAAFVLDEGKYCDKKQKLLCIEE